jgi:hypothetical protein
MSSPCCVSVCPSLFPSLRTFELINRFYKIQQGCHSVEGNLDSIIVKLAASTVLKLRTLKLRSLIQNLH